MKNDYRILRELANRYHEIASSDKNFENIARHKKVNDLKPTRPIVLIDEIPWHEMDIDGQLKLQCEHPYLRNIENTLRTNLYKWKYMPADMVLTPYLGVEKVVTTTGIGVTGRKTFEHEKDDIKAEVYADQLPDEGSLDKLKFEKISYDEQQTKQNFALVADAIGDILPVKITGIATGYSLACKTWDDIVSMRGLEQIFYEMIDEPEFIHKLVGKLTDIYCDTIRQYDELGLFDGDAQYNHSASALTDDLHPDRTHVRAKDVWGRGMAQILASVSPDMLDEFDIQYMIRAMSPFGLVYYGCCEPLHNKMHVVEKIPNLRKISITPWADVDIVADVIQKRYVVSAKTNPAILSTTTLNVESAKSELEKIVNACRRNGCSLEIIMKDITTVGGNPNNLFQWEKIAMQIVSQAM